MDLSLSLGSRAKAGCFRDRDRRVGRNEAAESMVLFFDNDEAFFAPAIVTAFGRSGRPSNSAGYVMGIGVDHLFSCGSECTPLRVECTGGVGVGTIEIPLSCSSHGLYPP